MEAVIHHCGLSKSHANVLFLAQDIAVLRRTYLFKRDFQLLQGFIKMPCNGGKLLQDHSTFI